MRGPAPTRLPVTRVLITAHYYPPHVGGIEHVAQMEARELVQRGISVHVLTSNVRPTSPQAPGMDATTGPDGVEVERVRAANPLERFGVPFPLFSPMRLLLGAWRGVRRCDLAHVHDVLYVNSWVVALCCWMLRRPYVVTQHVAVVAHPSRLVTLVQRALYATIGRLIWNNARMVFYLNLRVRDSLIDLCVRPELLAPLINGVDLDGFRPAGSPEERASIRARFGLPPAGRLVLFAGRLVPKKGFDKLVAAARDQDGWQAVLAGSGAGDGQHDERGVQWLGPLQRADLALVYRACDIFALPSEAEGFPLTIQEAMASGLPIVTTVDRGYEMYGLDERLFRFVEPSGSDLRGVIDSIVGDEVLRAKMAQYSRSVAEAQFSWKQHVDDLLTTAAGKS